MQESKYYRHITGRADFLAGLLTGGHEIERKILARNVENLHDSLIAIINDQDSEMERICPDCRKLSDGYHAMSSILRAIRTVDDRYDLLFTQDRNGEYRKVELLDRLGQCKFY